MALLRKGNDPHSNAMNLPHYRVKGLYPPAVHARKAPAVHARKFNADYKARTSQHLRMPFGQEMDSAALPVRHIASICRPYEAK